MFHYGRASRLQGINPLHEHKGQLKKESKGKWAVFLLCWKFFFVSVYMIWTLTVTASEVCVGWKHCDILHSLGENKQVSFQVGKYCSQCLHELMKAVFIATDNAFLICFTACIFARFRCCSYIGIHWSWSHTISKPLGLSTYISNAVLWHSCWQRNTHWSCWWETHNDGKNLRYRVKPVVFARETLIVSEVASSARKPSVV